MEIFVVENSMHYEEVQICLFYLLFIGCVILLITSHSHRREVLMQGAGLLIECAEGQ